MSGLSKPTPWNWSWERTLACRLGLPPPLWFAPCWEGSGRRLCDVVAGTGGLPASSTTHDLWSGGGAAMPKNLTWGDQPRLRAARSRAYVVYGTWTGTGRCLGRSQNQEFLLELVGANQPSMTKFGVAQYPAAGSIQLRVPQFVVGTYRAGAVRIYRQGYLDATYTGVSDPASTGSIDWVLGESSPGICHYALATEYLTSAQIALLAGRPYLYHTRYSPVALRALAQAAVPLLLSGLIEGVGSASGSLQVSRLLSGAASGAGQVTGNAEIRRLLAGSLAGRGGVDAALEISRQLGGSIAGSGAVTGEAEIRRLFSGSLDGAGSATGELEIARRLAGIVAGTGTAAAELLVARLLAGSVFGTGALAGELLIIHALVCYGGSVEIATLFGGLLLAALGFGGSMAAAATYGGTAEPVELSLGGAVTPAVSYGGTVEGC